MYVGKKSKLTEDVDAKEQEIKVYILSSAIDGSGKLILQPEFHEFAAVSVKDKQRTRVGVEVS